MELVEAMRTQHACRHYRPDAVPHGFQRAVEAARFGPQGGNRQPVRFLIETDGAKRRQLAEWYLVPWKAYFEAASSGLDAIEAASGDEKSTQVMTSNPELLGIPAELCTAAFIVAGYPTAPFPTKLARRPVEEIAFLDTFDHPLTAD